MLITTKLTKVTSANATQVGTLSLGGGDVFGAVAWLAAGGADGGLLYAVRSFNSVF